MREENAKAVAKTLIKPATRGIVVRQQSPMEGGVDEVVVACEQTQRALRARFPEAGSHVSLAQLHLPKSRHLLRAFTR